MVSRQIGIEIEFNGLDFSRTVDIVLEYFGGKATSSQNYVATIGGTNIGEITIEVDAKPVLEMDKKFNHQLPEISEPLIEIATQAVPLEIVMPPVTLDKIPFIDGFLKKLRDAGAKGTFDKIYYAFGVHLNPEITSEETQYLKTHIQAFSLLSPWLFKQHNVDFMRKFFPFITPYPDQYLDLILSDDYNPDLTKLIKDYHTHNPTRNRALDMLPVFSYFNEDLVRDLYGKEEKINKRPTFHYRLPNSDLENTDWSIQNEFEIWQKVEELAADYKSLLHLFSEYAEHKKSLLRTEKDWIEQIDDFFKK